ncbi:MAG: sulfatase [Myxococcota bacterium]
MACGGEPPVARNVILISVDTLRADHLGCYGYDRPTSPYIDAMAREGLLFEDASSTSPWTLPAHASLLVGRYPAHHGVRAIGRVLPPDLPTLASLLRVQGFTTGAVVNLLALQQTHRLLSGFESTELIGSDQSAAGAAERVTQAAMDWLEAHREGRSFLFVHYYDVHSDYRSLPEHERLFTRRTSDFQGSTRQIIAITVQGKVPADAEDLPLLYDAGIRQIDRELGRLFGWLEERGWLEDTLVVFTSDHGEEFFDHGPDPRGETSGVSHGHSLFQELVRVPLILRGPSIPRQVRVTEPVSLVDVVPTVLGSLGLAAPSELDGVDLRPLFESRPFGGERYLYFETSRSLRTPNLEGVRRGRYKLVTDLAAGEHRLYDLSRDPGESADLSDELPEVVRQLLADLEHARAERLEAEERELSDPERERLKALGYL